MTHRREHRRYILCTTFFSLGYDRYRFASVAGRHVDGRSSTGFSHLSVKVLLLVDIYANGQVVREVIMR